MIYLLVLIVGILAGACIEAAVMASREPQGFDPPDDEASHLCLALANARLAKRVRELEAQIAAERDAKCVTLTGQKVPTINERQ